MNVALWVLQIVMALLYIAGGAYKISGADQLAGQFAMIPGGAWRALGAFEVIAALLLIFPAAMKLKPRVTAHAAAALALETFALAAMYARYSTAITATNPMPWAIVMGLLVAFLAYGRYALRPIVEPEATTT
ncbi:MAG TPA: hypothetical protein VJ867_14245 [Gemmatimonadaceae bacterium]|nr:hypothetical protein [Gemmatimonadaceae bacterium]